MVSFWRLDGSEEASRGGQRAADLGAVTRGKLLEQNESSKRFFNDTPRLLSSSSFECPRYVMNGSVPKRNNDDFQAFEKTRSSWPRRVEL
jgi:hypothetical protein